MPSGQEVGRRVVLQSNVIKGHKEESARDRERIEEDETCPEDARRRFHVRQQAWVISQQSLSGYVFQHHTHKVGKMIT